MLIIDAHQDLAYNMLTFGRDYTRSAAETRRLEQGTDIPLYTGDTLLGWPEYQRGQVALVFATLFAAPLRLKAGDWDTQCYATFDQAHALYIAQIDAYQRLVDDHPAKFRLVHTLADLQSVLAAWEPGGAGNDLQPDPQAEAPQQSQAQAEAEGCPVGLVILMEGAEGVRSPGELEQWWARGVRLIGPAWAGTRFCGGTREPGPLTPDGYALLAGMASFGFTLDISHMDEQAVFQALDEYPGQIIASHSNAAALLKGLESNRFLSDRQIRGLIERDGLIGVVPCNSFLKAGWTAADGRHAVSLHHLVAQIDHICQIAGDARHVGLGTDFDGGFGWQSAPAEVDTIADLQKLVPILAEKGYTQTDIAAVLSGNWSSMLQRTLPETA